jgi:hypothetical protein
MLPSEGIEARVSRATHPGVVASPGDVEELRCKRAMRTRRDERRGLIVDDHVEERRVDFQ